MPPPKQAGRIGTRLDGTGQPLRVSRCSSEFKGLGRAGFALRRKTAASSGVNYPQLYPPKNLRTGYSQNYPQAWGFRIAVSEIVHLSFGLAP
jgi:hypothetical protein